VYLGYFLRSIRGIFRLITPVGNSIDVLIDRGVLVPLTSCIITATAPTTLAVVIVAALTPNYKVLTN